MNADDNKYGGHPVEPQREIARAWLAKIRRVKRPGRRTSYGLKHLAERSGGKYRGYVSEAVLIEEAIAAGFTPYLPKGATLHPRFNMSERSITKASKRQEGEE